MDEEREIAAFVYPELITALGGDEQFDAKYNSPEHCAPSKVWLVRDDGKAKRTLWGVVRLMTPVAFENMATDIVAVWGAEFQRKQVYAWSDFGSTEGAWTLLEREWSQERLQFGCGSVVESDGAMKRD